MTDNPWAYWEAREAGQNPQAHADDPQCGYYRWFKKDGYGGKRYSEPVIYWLDEYGKMHCNVGKWKSEQEPSEDFARNLWNTINQNTISKALFERVAAEGKPWDDEPPGVPMGSNRPPEPETFEELRDAVEDLGREAIARVEKGDPIKDQAEADQIANLADRLAELNHKIKDVYHEEKKPHDLAVEAVQKKWKPLLVWAKVYETLKYNLLTPWFTQEERRKRAETEAARAEGAEAAEPPRSRAGTRGRAMSLRTFKRAEIIDYAATLDFFKERDEVRNIVQSLADRVVKTGTPVPGTKVIEEQRAV